MTQALFASLLVAADAAPAVASRSPLSGMTDMLPLLGIFAVMYFLVIRPANRKQREQQALVAALKKDDEVVTQSGVVGRIVSLDERIAVLDVGERGGTRIRVLRDRIAGPFVVTPAATAVAPRASAQK